MPGKDGADDDGFSDRGAQVSRSRTVITLEAKMEDAQGRRHAHCTSTCVDVSRKS